MNDLALRVGIDEFSQDDYAQLMQLIGYSVSGFGELEMPEDLVQRADDMAEKLYQQEK